MPWIVLAVLGGIAALDGLKLIAAVLWIGAAVIATYVQCHKERIALLIAKQQQEAARLEAAQERQEQQYEWDMYFQIMGHPHRDDPVRVPIWCDKINMSIKEYRDIRLDDPEDSDGWRQYLYEERKKRESGS